MSVCEGEGVSVCEGEGGYRQACSIPSLGCCEKFQMFRKNECYPPDWDIFQEKHFVAHGGELVAVFQRCTSLGDFDWLIISSAGCTTRQSASDTS